MITSGEKLQHPKLPKQSSLFRGIRSNHNGGYYCLICFHSYTTENELISKEIINKNHDNFHIDIPEIGNNIEAYPRIKANKKTILCLCLHKAFT